MKSLIMLGMLAMPLLSASASQIELKNIRLQGNGCPSDSHSTVVSPDLKTVSLLFDQLSVEVPFNGYDNDLDYSRGNKFLARKVCNIVLDIDLPQNEKVTHLEFQTDFRGFAYGDDGTSAKFSSQLLGFKGVGFANQRSVKKIVEKNFGTYSFDQDLDISKTKSLHVNSACSTRRDKSIQVVLKNYIEAKIHDRYAPIMPEASLVLDSSDMRGNFKIKVKTKPCGRYNDRDRDVRTDRHTRGDRALIAQCERAGGTWHASVRRCISIGNRYRRRY